MPEDTQPPASETPKTPNAVTLLERKFKHDKRTVLDLALADLEAKSLAAAVAKAGPILDTAWTNFKAHTAELAKMETTYDLPGSFTLIGEVIRKDGHSQAALKKINEKRAQVEKYFNILQQALETADLSKLGEIKSVKDGSGSATPG